MDTKSETLHQPTDSLGVASAAPCSPSSRALVCCFCGKSWSYDGESPKEPLLDEAFRHEKSCGENPYTSKIAELESECTRLHQLWHDAVEMGNVERKLADGLANGLLHETGTGDVLPLSIAYDAWKTARNQSPENA